MGLRVSIARMSSLLLCAPSVSTLLKCNSVQLALRSFWRCANVVSVSVAFLYTVELPTMVFSNYVKQMIHYC